MTDPTPDTQQVEMLKTLLHDSRTERTRLAAEVDRLRALADPAPVGLTEDEAEVVRQAREAYPEGDDPVSWATFLSQRLLAIIDRLSAPPVDDREREGEILLDGERWRVAWRSPLLGGSIDARLVPMSPSVDPEDAFDV